MRTILQKSTLKFLLVLLLVFSFNGVRGQFSITSGSTNYVQDFNTLASGTWSNNSTLTGWYARTTATASITTYGANTGSTTAAGLYSYGASQSTERSLGYATSNAFTGNGGSNFLGWRLVNNTGSTITSVTVTFTGEQWRRESQNIQSLLFDYQQAAVVSDLITGTWTNVSSLTFNSPTTGGGSAALDGNAAANRVANISATIQVSIPAGEEIMIRWSDLNDSGNDHHLTIDDVIVNATILQSGPSIVAIPSSLNFGSTFVNSNSPSQSFTVNANNLQEGVLVTAPAGFQVSPDDSAFSQSFTLPQTSGAISNGLVYVRFSPTNAGSVNGNVTLESTGAITQNVAVAGTGAFAPINAPVATAATGVGVTSFQANWEPVEGATSYRLDVSLSPTFEETIAATDLFISEYVEGSSNNKYIEIYNGTGNTVDLSNYVLQLYTNGATAVSAIQPLSGSLANGATLVYRNTLAVLPGTTGYPTSGVCNFNGDDALAIYNSTTETLVDVFGRIGSDPGAAWTAPGFSTVDKTLVRKPTVSSGIAINPPGPSFPTLETEWIQFDIDNVDNLGSHSYTAATPSFVAGYENLTVNGLSQVVTGLVADTTYYYRVRAFNGNTSLNSNVIQVTTAQEIPVTQVVASQCNGTLTELYGRINVNSVPGATMYRYRVARSTAPTTYEFFESPYPRFRLNNFTTLEINFGFTYLVAVQTAAVFNGNTLWSEFGAECSITTPAPSTVVVSSNQCGQTLPTILSRTFFNSVPNANLYRYRVALQSNPAIVEEIESVFTSFRLNNLTTVPLTSETNYLVSIQARIIIDGNEVWTEYGTPCVIRTPDFPTTSIQVSQCGDEEGAYTVSSLTEKLFCDFLSGASYRFKIEKYDNNVLIYSQTVTNPINWITLSSFTGLQPGETYNISVAYNYYGEGPFDKVCTLMVPALNLKPSDSYENSVSKLSNEFKAMAYPNPFRNSFALNVTTASQSAVQLAVFDMTGRLLDTRTVAVSALESIAIGENYPAGVYNVVITQDDEMQTIRVIKQ